MRELIERFRYRFHLWWRDEREDFAGAFKFEPPLDVDFDPYAPGSPQIEALRRSESIPKFLIKSIGVYLCILFLIAQGCRLTAILIPSARFVASILFLVLASLWTVFWIVFTILEYKIRKARRRAAKESSNKSLQPTAGRSDV